MNPIVFAPLQLGGLDSFLDAICWSGERSDVAQRAATTSSRVTKMPMPLIAGPTPQFCHLSRSASSGSQSDFALVRKSPPPVLAKPKKKADPPSASRKRLVDPIVEENPVKYVLWSDRARLGAGNQIMTPKLLNWEILPPAIGILSGSKNIVAFSSQTSPSIYPRESSN